MAIILLALLSSLLAALYLKTIMISLGLYIERYRRKDDVTSYCAQTAIDMKRLKAERVSRILNTNITIISACAFSRNTICYV